MAKAVSYRNKQAVKSQTLFDVPAVRKESGQSSTRKKQRDSAPVILVDLIGINAAYAKEGHVLSNRNNQIK